MIELSPKAQNARNSLALILASSGEARWKEAWALVASPAGGAAPSAADRRMQIRVLFRNGGEQQRAQRGSCWKNWWPIRSKRHRMIC